MQVTEPVEIWLSCDVAPYEVSTLGRVRRDGKILKPCLRSGYWYVTFCRNKDDHSGRAVHRLVAEAFCDRRAGNDVNHVNGIKSDNRAANLEWLTRSENQRHAADIGLKPWGERSHLCSKLTRESATRLIGLRGTTSQAKAAAEFGVSPTHVGKIWRGQKWRQLTRATQTQNTL